MSITIKSGASSDEATVDATSKAMRVTLYDTAGNSNDKPESNSYGVVGGTSAVVAAGLAGSTNLMAIRNSAGSKKIYITQLRFVCSTATLGLTGGVAGSIAWQRFTAQTPTGGTARTPYKKRAADATSSVTDARDSNAALTGAAPTWGDLVVGYMQVPNTTVAGGSTLFVFDLEDSPLELAISEGLALRTQTAMPATQTWMYHYAIEWYEA